MKTEKSIKIEVEGEDIDTLKSALKKVCDEISKPGLKNNTITEKESDIIKTLKDSL